MISAPTAAPRSAGRVGHRRPRQSTRMPAWAGSLVGLVLIVGVWWFIALTFYADSGSLPQPGDVFVQLLNDATDPVYWNAIAVTTQSAALGYLIGVGISMVLAFVVIVVARSRSFITQLAVVCSCLPITAIAPLVTLMSPSGSRSTSVFLAALVVIFPTVIGTLVGLRAASATQLDVVRAYGGGTLKELTKVRLIAAVPSVIAALKIAAPAAFLGAVLGEYFLIGVDSGLGILLLAAQITIATAKLWAIAIICGAIAGLAYFLIGLAGRLAAPWSTGDPLTDGRIR